MRGPGDVHADASTPRTRFCLRPGGSSQADLGTVEYRDTRQSREISRAAAPPRVSRLEEKKENWQYWRLRFRFT